MSQRGRLRTHYHHQQINGTKLIREWEGIEHAVTVMADGYEWSGKKYKSLSGVAKAITGTSWSGFRFFGFRDNPRSAA